MNKLNISEFATKAHTSRETVYDWIERGFLEKKHWGKKPYLTQEDLMLVPSIRKLLKENQHRL